jgi:hypothetical protein
MSVTMQTHWRVGGCINTAMKQASLVSHEFLVILVHLGQRGYNVIDNGIDPWGTGQVA